MFGFSQSLNVSVAAAVALSYATQQRRQWLGGSATDDAARSKALLEFWVKREVEGKARDVGTTGPT